MGLFDSLFGSRKETIQPGVPQITQATTQTPEQEEFLKSLIANLQGATAGGGRAAPFQGDLTAGPSGLETQSFDLISQLLNPGGAAQQFGQRSLEAFDPQTSIDRFNEFQLPSLETGFAEKQRQFLESRAGSGGFQSGDLLRSGLRNINEFEQGVASLRGNQLNFDEQFGLSKNLAGLNALIGTQQQGLAGGGIQRGIEQGGLDRILNEFLRQQTPDQLLSLAPTALGTQGFENIVQAPTTAFGPSAASQIAELLGGAGRLASGIASF